MSRIIDDLQAALTFAKNMGINVRWMMKGTDRYVIQRLSTHLLKVQADREKFALQLTGTELLLERAANVIRHNKPDAPILIDIQRELDAIKPKQDKKNG